MGEGRFTATLGIALDGYLSSIAIEDTVLMIAIEDNVLMYISTACSLLQKYRTYKSIAGRLVYTV